MSILRLSVYSYDKYTMTVYMNLKFVRARFGQYDTIDFVVILPPGKPDEAIEVEVVTHHSTRTIVSIICDWINGQASRSRRGGSGGEIVCSFSCATRASHDIFSDDGRRSSPHFSVLSYRIEDLYRFHLCLLVFRLSIFVG